MSLREPDLFDGTRDKVEIAIERLQHFEPPEGYYLAFSGGKDSVVIKELSERSGVVFDAHYHVTTIDPPELVKFIRDWHPDVIWNRAPRPFLRELITHGYPSRRNRWCCELYKEGGGDGRTVVTGVRWSESSSRKNNRKLMENCTHGGNQRRKRMTVMNPIVDWTSEEVWEFIHQEHLPYCKLYDEGFQRIGCLMCPMARGEQRLMECDAYPRYRAQFIKHFQKLWEKRMKMNPAFAGRWASGEDMFWWWLNDTRKSVEKEQRMLFE